jgi:hypothetical protein
MLARVNRPRARAIPRLGGSVTVVFLGRRVPGVVIGVEPGARALLVSTDEDETIQFALSRATGTFFAGGNQTGPRLLFDEFGPGSE